MENINSKFVDDKMMRQQMVNNQIIRRGIKDRKIIDALLEVPRHLFVPNNQINFAYEDYPLPIEYGQTISQPYIVALMTELLELDEKDKVLEIGTGSGYQTAILAKIVKEVYTIERIKELSIHAETILKNLQFNNIYFFCLDGTLGLPAHAPYQKIIVTAAAPKVPQSLIEQLDNDGKMVIPLGEKGNQSLTRIKKSKGNIYQEKTIGCTFVPLIGENGWPEIE